MDVLWLLIVGLLFGGWLVLDGFTVGVGLLLPFLKEPAVRRRTLLTAVGPFLLANEVWLVATAGVLAGTYPRLEGELLSRLYPVVMALVASWAVRDAGFWFRSRGDSARWRRFWEGAIVAGSLGLAVTAGLVIGNLLGGPPGEPEGLGVLDPLSVLCAALVTGLFALHGAVFLNLRLPQAQGAAAGAVAGRLAVPLLGLGALTLALSFVFGGLDRPWAALVPALAGFAAVALAGRLMAAGRPRGAFAWTAIAMITPAAAAGVGSAPDLLAGAAAGQTLERLATMAVPVLFVLLLAQAWLWWIFRHRVGEDSVAFF